MKGNSKTRFLNGKRSRKVSCFFHRFTQAVRAQEPRQPRDFVLIVAEVVFLFIFLFRMLLDLVFRLIRKVVCLFLNLLREVIRVERVSYRMKMVDELESGFLRVDL